MFVLEFTPNVYTRIDNKMMIYFDIPLEIKEFVTVEGSAHKDGFIVHLAFDDRDPDSICFIMPTSVEAKSESSLIGKVNKVLREWGKKYNASILLKKQCEAENQNEMAYDDQDYLANILNYHLKENVIDVWKKKQPIQTSFDKKLEDFINYHTGSEFIRFSDYRPVSYEKIEFPDEPTSEEWQKTKNGSKKVILSPELFQRKQQAHIELIEKIRLENISRKEIFEQLCQTYQTSILAYENAKMEFEKNKQFQEQALRELKLNYANKQTQAIEQYCDLVLSHSELPTYITQDYLLTKWELEYKPENEVLVINYWLPTPDEIPNTKSVKYVKTKDELVETKLSTAAQKENYNNALYQICLKTIHKLFQYDEANAIYTVAFNGIVTSTNKATGLDETKVILSLLANKDEFLAINFSNVDPKQTFKHLKGVSAANLINITPVPPIIQLNKTDKRFIDSVDVVHTIDQTTNLAAMDWQDFEHLIRELLEQEFSTNGGEVKVTQGSSDGGVDAIAFDPDPIRGGKIVIQAKRYTNTVGISAVRDLYGTVMNEGATKGVLVTTSSFGSDSYNFAKNKPLTLLDGGNLLALLEKHGHKAVINIQEAKKILNNKATPYKT